MCDENGEFDLSSEWDHVSAAEAKAEGYLTHPSSWLTREGAYTKAKALTREYRELVIDISKEYGPLGLLSASVAMAEVGIDGLYFSLGEEDADSTVEGYKRLALLHDKLRDRLKATCDDDTTPEQKVA